MSLETDLETIIDQHGLGAVLSTIGDICFGRAEHWPDHKAWSEAGTAIYSAYDRLAT
jgi:hypothetical protein